MAEAEIYIDRLRTREGSAGSTAGPADTGDTPLPQVGADGIISPAPAAGVLTVSLYDPSPGNVMAAMFAVSKIDSAVPGHVVQLTNSGWGVSLAWPASGDLQIAESPASDGLRAAAPPRDYSSVKVHISGLSGLLT